MKGSAFLWAGFAGICLLLSGISWLHKTHCTSVDSGYYLQSAGHLLEGRGYSIKENGQILWNSTFPVGYSVLIATLSGLAGFPVLVASKIVNLAAIGFSAWRWTNRLGSCRACWLLSIWLLGGFLKIAAYTWSETVFLIVLAEWIWRVHQFLQRPSFQRTILLFGIGCALFLVRYVGGFAFGLSGLLTVLLWAFPSWFQDQPDGTNRRLAAGWLLANAVAGVVAMGIYFLLNQELSGSYFGGDRFLPTETGYELASLFGIALLNEFLLIRDFSPSGNNFIGWIGLLSEVLLVSLMYRTYRSFSVRSKTLLRSNLLCFLFVLTGVTYLLVLFALRSVSPFDGPNLRLMAPFTLCLLQAILLWVSDFPISLQRQLRPFWLLFLLCSWLQLLPQSSLVCSCTKLPQAHQSQHSIISKSPVWASIRTKPSCSASLLLPVR